MSAMASPSGSFAVAMTLPCGEMIMLPCPRIATTR